MDMSTIPAPQERTFDDNVSAIVRVLIAMKATTAKALAPAVGMSKSTLYSRMSEGGWAAAELDRIASYFDVDPAIFFRPVERVVGQNWKEMSRPDLRVLPGGGSSDSSGRRPKLTVVD